MAAIPENEGIGCHGYDAEGIRCHGYDAEGIGCHASCHRGPKSRILIITALTVLVL